MLSSLSGLRRLAIPVLLSLSLIATTGLAQAGYPLPTGAGASNASPASPELTTMLRQRVAQSGLTPDQIRSRLDASGFASSLLDGYMPAGGRASLASTAPTASDDLLRALQALGMADSAETAALRASARAGRDGGHDSTASRRARGLSLTQSDATREDSLQALAFDLGVRREALDSLRTAVGDADALATLGDVLRSLVHAGHVVYGLEFFRRGTSAFEPLLAGPVASTYRLGPGDQLVLLVSGDVEAAYTLPVTREGFIVIPHVGELPVASLTLAQLEDLLHVRLGRVYPGVSRGAGARTRFSISVARVRRNQVVVTGDVLAPGSYQLAATGTALSALYAAGGPSDVGSLRNVQVRRGGHVVARIDLYDYLLRGDNSRDLPLEQGDVVFVPPAGPRAQVIGEATRPGIYEVAPGETLADAIAAAGGFSALASRRRVQVTRVLPPDERGPQGRDRVTLDVDGQDAALRATAVHGGDIVRLFPVLRDVRDRVVVLGHVFMPGTQGFRVGMRLSEALAAAGGVRPGVHLGSVLISRWQPDSSRAMLRTSLADSAGALRDDLLLAERDEISVFPGTANKALRYVVVSGGVKRPGRIPFSDGMTLRDLILLAGGLTPLATTDSAELVRFDASPTSASRGTLLHVRIDESYRTGSPVGSGADIPLQPFDNVLVRQRGGTEGARSVIVTGQVRRPGRYALLGGNEHLLDVLSRAGGLGPDGYAPGITVTRQTGSLGRLGIDAELALRDPSHPDNLLLADGDSIDVPLALMTVTVTGAVHRPTTLAYVKGARATDYVAMAGGATPRGDARRAFVEQPGGRIESGAPRRLRPDRNPTPQPGSVVMVPERDAHASGSAATLSMTLQILGSLATLAALLR